MHSYGKLRMEKKTIENENQPPIVIGVFFDANDEEWHSVFRATPSNWYVAINDDNIVVSAEQDAEESQIAGYTILGLDDLSGYENHHGNGSVYGKYWDGTKIVDPASTVTGQITTAPDDLFGGPTLGEIYGNS